MIKLFYFFLLFFCLTGCKEKTAQQVEIGTVDEAKVETTVIEEDKDNSTNTVQLLQGTWVNIDDPRFAIVFKGTGVTNRYDGIENETNIQFSIGPSCLNGLDAEGSYENTTYISTTGDADECYKIIHLDEKRLTLTYTGEGNTLNFTKE